MSVSWGTALQVQKTCDLEGYQPEAGGGLDWPCALAPVTPDHLVGNVSAIREIHEWYQGVSASPAPALLIVHGACGVGKTSTVRVQASATGCRLLELAADDARTCSVIDDAVQSCRKADESVVLFLDDAISLLLETTGLVSLVKHVKAAFQAPSKRSSNLQVVVCFDSDISDVKLQPLLNIKQAVIVHMKPVSEAVHIVPFLQKAAKEMNSAVNYFDALLVAQQSDGDLRNMLIRLQVEAALSRRDSVVLAERRKKMKKKAASSLNKQIIHIHNRGPLAPRDMTQLGEEGVDASRLLLQQFHHVWPDCSSSSVDVLHMAEVISTADVLLSTSFCVGDSDCVEQTEDNETIVCCAAVGTVSTALAQCTGFRSSVQQLKTQVKRARRPLIKRKFKSLY